MSASKFTEVFLSFFFMKGNNIGGIQLGYFAIVSTRKRPVPFVPPLTATNHSKVLNR
jgi:hypothetical protein